MATIQRPSCGNSPGSRRGEADQRLVPQRLRHRRREASRSTASAPPGQAVAVGRWPMIRPSAAPAFSQVQLPDRVHLVVIRAEAVPSRPSRRSRRCDGRRSRPQGAFMQHHRHAGAGDLPGGLGPGKVAPMIWMASVILICLFVQGRIAMAAPIGKPPMESGRHPLGMPPASEARIIPRGWRQLLRYRPTAGPRARRYWRSRVAVDGSASRRPAVSMSLMWIRSPISRPVRSTVM